MAILGSKKNGYRRLVQLGFAAVTLVVGVQFYLFVASLENGIIPGFDRPPGVEAFLPISALVSVRHFFITHTVNPIHPSGLILFVLICISALVVKKGFCAFVCPIGLISELLASLNRKLFSRPWHLPRWPDLILRSIKYLIAAFFIWNIFFQMPGPAVTGFVHSTYNKFADVSMLFFFTQISPRALIILLVLVALTLAIPHFWCRYLCPYGALLGAIGLFSLARIRRDPARCTQCRACERHCPSRIKITAKPSITSPECSFCQTCVETCPEKGAITPSLSGRVRFSPWITTVIIVGIFVLGITGARVTGHWQNQVSKSEYLGFVLQRQMALMKHQMGDPEVRQRMIRIMKNIRESQRMGDKPQ